MKILSHQSAGRSSSSSSSSTSSRTISGRARGMAGYGNGYSKNIRRFITPEGVDLELRIASAGQRFTALIIDLLILLLIIVTAGLVLFLVVAQGGDLGFLSIVGMIAFFFLRVFWFAGFEMGQRAATPGKRMLGIRVVARDGGRLTFGAVMARNMIRELEIFLPFSFFGNEAAQGLLGAWANIAGLIWSLSLSLFLLFNRDRMRLGDVLAGTWVVMAERPKLQKSATALRAERSDSSNENLLFSEAELAAYGIFELQILERLLRDKNNKTINIVAQRIRNKIARDKAEDDHLFLTSYYKQLKHRLEQQMLLGKRRENKYDSQ